MKENQSKLTNKNKIGFTTEQSISQTDSPINGMSTEELYRQKEAYDAKFTLYKGSILPTDTYKDSLGNHK